MHRIDRLGELRVRQGVKHSHAVIRLSREMKPERLQQHQVRQMASSERAGFAVQLALIRHPRLTLAQVAAQPCVDLDPLVGFIAGQLELPATALADYAAREQTIPIMLARSASPSGAGRADHLPVPPPRHSNTTFPWGMKPVNKEFDPTKGLTKVSRINCKAN
jgi:hypothetical protein